MTFLRRRSPGRSRLSTPRRETDEVEFVSGIVGDTLCGAPLCAIIKNADVRRGDYTEFADLPRPGHADYTAAVKFGGHQDPRAADTSGRLTAPLCVAGGICAQILPRTIFMSPHISRKSPVLQIRDLTP